MKKDELKRCSFTEKDQKFLRECFDLLYGKDYKYYLKMKPFTDRQVFLIRRAAGLI